MNIAATANFHGTDLISFPWAARRTVSTTISASKSEWVVLANAYVDLGTWWCMTPFVGAGVGAARVSITNFTDTATNQLQSIGVPVGGCRCELSAPTASNGILPGRCMPVVAYKVTPNFTVELAYRYLDMGDGLTGVASTFDGSPTTSSTFKFKNITSHDLKLGVRWNSRQPAGLRAAAGPQGLIEQLIC